MSLIKLHDYEIVYSTFTIVGIWWNSILMYYLYISALVLFHNKLNVINNKTRCKCPDDAYEDETF